MEGSGPRAEGYSEVVIDLLEQLLESGFTEQTALKLINSVLLTGNQWQEPAAVDMALFDRYSGTCQFLKMGAACTYIKRGGWWNALSQHPCQWEFLNRLIWKPLRKNFMPGILL